MPSPPTSQLPVPTSNLSVSAVRRRVFLVRCLLLVFGFPRPALPLGVSRTAAVCTYNIYTYINVYVCVSISMSVLPRPSVTSRSSSCRNFCASKNNNRLLLCSHSGGAAAPAPAPALHPPLAAQGKYLLYNVVATVAAWKWLRK